MGRTIGYLRVSTVDQDLEKNKSDILGLANNLALGNVDWIEEKVSGTKDWRKRKLGETFEKLKTDNTRSGSFSREPNEKYSPLKSIWS